MVGREGLLFVNLRAMYINIVPEQAPSSLSLVDSRRCRHLSILLIFAGLRVFIIFLCHHGYLREQPGGTASHRAPGTRVEPVSFG